MNKFVIKPGGSFNIMVTIRGVVFPGYYCYDDEAEYQRFYGIVDGVFYEIEVALVNYLNKRFVKIRSNSDDIPQEIKNEAERIKRDIYF